MQKSASPSQIPLHKNPITTSRRLPQHGHTKTAKQSPIVQINPTKLIASRSQFVHLFSDDGVVELHPYTITDCLTAASEQRMQTASHPHRALNPPDERIAPKIQLHNRCISPSIQHPGLRDCKKYPNRRQSLNPGRCSLSQFLRFGILSISSSSPSPSPSSPTY